MKIEVDGVSTCTDENEYKHKKLIVEASGNNIGEDGKLLDSTDCDNEEDWYDEERIELPPGALEAAKKRRKEKMKRIQKMNRRSKFQKEFTVCCIVIMVALFIAIVILMFKQ